MEAEEIAKGTPILERAAQKGKSEKPASKKKAANPPNGKEAAKALLETVEIFTVAKFGIDGSFDSTERFLIEGPLARLIERYGAIAGQFSGLIDPAMVLAGTAIFAIRLGNVAAQQELAKSKEKLEEKPEQPKEPIINGSFFRP